MRTPSLNARVVSVGVAVVMALLVSLDLLVFLVLRDQLPGPDLRRLLLFEVGGTILLGGLAALLLRWVSEVALRPLEPMVAAARRTEAGRRGERLRPDRPDTRLGELAAAYDDMLDALENALADANAAQARSERLQEHAQRILETANDAFVAIDADGRITEWNAEAERTFGWTRQEVLGRCLADTVIPPDLRASHIAGVERFKATGEGRIMGRRVELSALHRDGHRFPVELAVWATRDDGAYAFNAFVRDVTERKQAEEAQARLASIVEFSTDAIIGKSLEGTILTWNQGAEAMYGYTAEEMIGQPVSRLVPSDRAHEVTTFLDAIRRGEAVPHHETTRLRKDGSTVEVTMSTSPIRDRHGAVVGASTISRDISEQCHMRSELDTTMAKLEAALHEARQSETRARRFLDDAAHQLRTPIAGIRACAEALMGTASAPQRERLLVDMLRESARAGRLMRSLLRMARIHQGRSLAPAPCDVVGLCADEADRVRGRAPALDVTVGAAPDLDGLKPELDADAVHEIVANLLDNAVRHAASRIDVVVGVNDGWVEIRVADDGPGLPEDLRERAFERFVSLDREGGTGLGLPIARGLARAHGGDLCYGERAFVVQLPSGADVAPVKDRARGRRT